MIDDVLFGLTLFAALATGIMSGLYFCFSTFMIQALDRLPTGQTVAAMQSINKMILNPLFGLVFGGSAVAGAILTVAAIGRWDGAESAYRLTGGLLVFFGSLVVTIARNVPLNNALEAVEPGTAAADQVWARYVDEWVSWNHVRTVATIASTALLILALD